jgi:hypothetical protein
MTILRVVGLFREFEEQYFQPLEPIYRLPSLAVSARAPDATQERILRHIEGGTGIVDEMSIAFDPIAKKSIGGGFGIASDGEWVWRMYLPYVVSTYNPPLDPVFVASLSVKRESIQVTDEFIRQAMDAIGTHLRSVVAK